MTAARNSNIARMQFSIPSTRPSVSKVADRVHAFAAEHLRNKSALDRARLVTNEVLNNALIHGNGANPEKSIQIEAVANGAFFTLRVEDEGEGFDPSRVEDPRNEKYILRDHGRGLYLVKELADTVVFECGGRCVRVTIRE